RGKPPTPSAMSRPSEPVDTTCRSFWTWASPIFMIEPLPNCFSIWANAAASALVFWSSTVLSKGMGGLRSMAQRGAGGYGAHNPIERSFDQSLGWPRQPRLGAPGGRSAAGLRDQGVERGDHRGLAHCLAISGESLC